MGNAIGMSDHCGIGALVRGVAAGAAGTAAMTGWQEAVALFQSSDEDGSEGGDPWESASAPAKVAKKIFEGLTHREVPASWIPVLTEVMHWSYGIGWGALYGLSRRRLRGNPLLTGLAFGTGVWAASYAELMPLGIYEPPWRYPAKTLALDLSYHVVYGAGVGAAYAALD